MRRLIALLLLVLALAVVIAGVLLAFTPAGNALLAGVTATPTPTLVPYTPTPPPTPAPILTPRNPLPKLSASEALLFDVDSGRVLADVNGEMPRPMASTTKIMTALIAIQTADLDQVVTIRQDAINEVIQHNGSSAQLVVGDKIRLRDLLYGLMLPSGDDAAIAIADTLAGSPQNFTRTMNLFAQRLRLFQTHYVDPDGLSSVNHYSTAFDLTRLARYALTVPLFAQIVQTKHYTLAPTVNHRGYTWDTTNALLSTYAGMTGIKTGFIEAAGYCLVFSATHASHHLIGVVLNAPSPAQRFADAKALLDWGFSLPLLPPNSFRAAS